MELLEDDVVDRHPQSRVLPGLYGYPPVRVLGHLVQVGGDHHELGTLMAGFGDEVDIGRPGHAEVGTHRDDVLGVVPVGTLSYVGLVTPDLREGVGQIGVPVVETHVDATEELQEA